MDTIFESGSERTHSTENVDSEHISASCERVKSMRTTKTAISLAVVVMMVLVSAAVMITSSSDADAPESARASASTDTYVQVGMPGTVAYWNPLNMQMAEDYIVTYLVYSTLFTYDQDWEGPVNDLATWHRQVIHPDGSMTTYINITNDAYFRSIGNLEDTSHQLTARDVSYTFNLIKNNSGGTFDIYLEDLSEFTALESTPGCGVLDVVSIWCPYPKATLIDDISMIPILPMYLWGPDGENHEANALASMDPDEQVGSGPFVFEDWLKDSWYKFKTAPNYHGEANYGAARTVDIPGVLYEVISDPIATCIEVNSGILDCGVLTGALHAFTDILGTDATVNVYKAAVAENGITDIAINAIPDVFDEGSGYLNRHPALLDPFVRKAIAMTLNKDYIVNVIMGGRPIMAHSVVQPGYWQKDIENKVVYDPAGAKAMLQANGWADGDGDGWLEATSSAYGVQMGLFPVGTELSGIRCQAIDTSSDYGKIVMAWPGWADDAGIQLIGTIETEATMVNKAWYAADYDIWVWHWGWGPEPIGGALSVWKTSEIEKAGDNCQMPMGPWWCHKDNITSCPYVDQAMIDEYDIMNPATWDGRFSAYDQNLTDAMRILDRDERKVVLDKLQQWIYDSYCELPPYYDLGLYGYTDCRFIGWGDWEAHNGLNVASGLPWIWFGLQPVGDNQMPVFNTPPLPSYEAEVGEPITFVIGVSDPEGDPIGVNWSFGDGDMDSHYLTGDTTVERLVSATHVYTEVAEGLTLTISLNDAPQHTIYTVATAQVDVLSPTNEPPDIHFIDRDPSTATIGQEVIWSIGVSDHEQGPDGEGLMILWYWDDGTYTNSSFQPVANDTVVVDTQSHAWAEAGTYNVTILVSDGQINVWAIIPYDVVTGYDGFVMAQIGEPLTLDPAIDYEPHGGEVIQNVYETLLFYDETDPEVLIPVLATIVPSVENGLISPDGMTYRFPLRQNVTFHDGTVMTTDDVAYSIQRVLRIHDPSSQAWMLEQVMTHYISFYIGNTIQEWINSEGVTESWLLDALPSDTNTVIEEDHMTAVAEAVAFADGDHAVVFRLTSSYPGFLHIMATTVASVVSMDYVEANGGIVNGEDNDHMASHACGTGPYMLQTWDVGTQVHLARFSDYWSEAPEIENVYILKTGDVNDRIQMLEEGIADSAYLTIDYEHIFEGDDYRIIKGLPDYDMSFAGFNFEIDTATAAMFGSDVPSDFFNDVHVRRAFASAIDYDLFIEVILSGNAIHPNGAIPKDMFGYDENVPERTFDLAAAEAELKMATNWATGNSWWNDGFSIALIYNAGNLQRQVVCELLKTALENMNSKFVVNIYALDWPTYLGYLQMTPCPFPMFWLGWGCDYADPDNFMTPLLDSHYGIFPYYTGYSNDTVNWLVRMAAEELDPDSRLNLYSNASTVAYDDTPYIWLTQSSSFHVERSWVTGYYFHPMLHGLDYAALGKSTTQVNTPPVALFTATPETTYVGGTIVVDASSSYDLEDSATALEVRWDWECDGAWDTDWTTEKTAYHQLLVAGEHTIALEVRDSEGLTDDTTHTVEAIAGSFVEGEFPDRVFTIVKSSDSRGPVKLDSKMKPLEDYSWWLEMTQMDGTKVVVNVYKSRAASSSLVSTSELTSVGDASEHVVLEEGAVYRVVIQYYGKAGIAELKEVAIPSTPVKYHEPILINGDDDFVPENGVVGGSGTQENPYIIAGWIIEPTEGSGITVLATTKYFIIENSRITGDIDTCMYGVHLEGVEHATLQSLNISDFWMGVHAKLTDDLTVTASQITWSSWGVFALRCGSISVTDSEVSHNRVGSGNHDGIMIQETDYAYVARNNLADNWDGVFTYFASNVQICDNTMAQTAVGIQALYTDNLVVSSNSIASTHYGMILVDCPDSIIESNTVTVEPSASDAYFGIQFISCRNLHVSSNVVDSFAHGIGTRDYWTAYPMSEEVVISGNMISNCSDSAVRIQLVSNMTVTANAFLLNGAGVHVGPTAHAVRIYHNDFLYNSVQAIEDPYCVGIEWDDGYPSGGNFWSDYTGVDLYSGVNQDIPGSDGIVDTPYTMGVVDRYPFMEPVFDW